MSFIQCRARADGRLQARPRRALRVLLLLAFLPVYTLAQSGGGIDIMGTGGNNIIQGRIYFPSGRTSDSRLKVRLESTNSGEILVYTDLNGSFSFRNLSQGSYRVTVEGGDDFETTSESVFIDEVRNRNPRGMKGVGATMARTYNLPIYLQPKRQVIDVTKPGVINAALAGVPKPALELYNKALDNVRRGETDRAVARLKEAVALFPEFSLALSELGVQYMKLRQTDKAIEVLRGALKLVPDDYATLLTYGVALYEKQAFAEAAESLRRAVRKNHSSPSAHLYLGLVLLKTRNFGEAERELKEAVKYGGGQLPLAHYYLGGLYWGRKEYAAAADELEAYLRLAPKAPDAARVRATIAELRGKK